MIREEFDNPETSKEFGFFILKKEFTEYEFVIIHEDRQIIMLKDNKKILSITYNDELRLNPYGADIKLLREARKVKTFMETIDFIKEKIL